MSLIPKVKCSRCDRSYSGLKNKCPYCGTSRSRGSKRTNDSPDSGARRMIQMLLALVLVVTVISMIATGGGDDNEQLGTGITQTQQEEENENNGDTEGQGDYETPPPPPPEPTPTPNAVTGLEIRWQFQQGNINEMTLSTGDSLEVWADVFPTDADTTGIDWSTDSPAIANIRVEADDFSRIELMAVGSGIATITVTAGGQTAELIVRVV